MLDPQALRAHYTAFLARSHAGVAREGEAPPRILLTGHSHQAWPDCARGALLEAFDDAAQYVDDKWARAFERGAVLRRYIAEQLASGPTDVVTPEQIALGQNTHELVSRFISALDLRSRPRIVTSSGEFHSLHRQLTRLAEAGVAVESIDAAPVESLSERLAAALDDRTAAVMVSSVLFQSAAVVPHLPALSQRAQHLGVEVLVDAYHGFGVLPLSLAQLGGEQVFVTAGGYKYAQWGEGCCFLRVPPSCQLRPVYTGWFSDFSGLEAARDGRPVGYGATPADRFAGSTYDSASHYRGAKVVEFFEAQRLSIDALRELSLHQTQYLIDQLFAGGLGQAQLLTPTAAERRAGFVAIRQPGASLVTQRMRARGVLVDSRGDVLRFGPAPYLLDAELAAGVAAYFASCEGVACALSAVNSPGRDRRCP